MLIKERIEHSYAIGKELRHRVAKWPLLISSQHQIIFHRFCLVVLNVLSFMSLTLQPYTAHSAKLGSKRKFQVPVRTLKSLSEFRDSNVQHKTPESRPFDRINGLIAISQNGTHFLKSYRHFARTAMLAMEAWDFS